MTSNIGTELYQKEHLGFRRGTSKEMKEEIISLLKKTFRPEFLNRLDDVILFSALEAENLTRIAYNLLAALRKRLGDNGILFDIEEEAVNLICREGYDPLNGARPLSRAIERLITKPLSEKIISGEFATGDKILVSVSEGNISFRKVEEGDDTWV